LVVFVVLVGLGIGIIQWRAHTRETAAELRHPPSGDFVTVGATKVHYKIMGDGPDLVLLHGASGNFNDFTLSLTERLTGRYRVIMFDRPGLGWTDRLPGHGGAWNNDEETPIEQAALLQAAADELGVKNPIVLGHSFGGIVALAWGLSRPDDTSALVLVGAVAEPWPGDLGWQYTINGRPLGGAIVIPMISALVPMNYVRGGIGAIFAPQQAPENYSEHLGVGLTLRRESMRANAQQVNALRPHVVEMQKSYGTLSMPIEIIHGDADTIVPLTVHGAVLVKDVPNGKLTVLAGAGHMPQHTHAAEVEASIDRAAVRAGLR
jgi:pimeloyl-ACP methyl ester carboxylesterase